MWFARRARRIETHSCSDECPCSGKGAVTVCRVKSEQMLVQTARHTSAYGTLMISPMFAQAFCLSVLPAHPCVGAGSAMAPATRNSRRPVRAVDSPSVAGESTNTPVRAARRGAPALADEPLPQVRLLHPRAIELQRHPGVWVKDVGSTDLLNTDGTEGLKRFRLAKPYIPPTPGGCSATPSARSILASASARATHPSGLASATASERCSA